MKDSRYKFICIWCGVNSDNEDVFKPCSAPDGDGHLFKRVLISEDFDLSPYCQYCGAMKKSSCNCGEIADND
jgi:hypothetical protein